MKRNQRIFLIGQAPCRGGDPDRPLVGGRTGGLLLKLSGAMSLRQYAGWFERRNLLRDWPGSAKGKGDLFPMKEARAAAASLEQSFGGRKVIFVGKNVAQAFGFGDVEFLSWRVARDGTAHAYSFAVIPHPSGVNLWWNVVANKVAAARFLGAAVRELPT